MDVDFDVDVDRNENVNPVGGQTACTWAYVDSPFDPALK